jgi:LAS superfamily LD-carboxypeptidase LdcB
METRDDALVRIAGGGVDRPRTDDRRRVRATWALRAVIGVFVLGTGLFVLAAGGASSVAAIGPLPECHLDDILTVPRDYDSWSVTLVDWILSVGKDYVPPDLASVRKAGLTGSGYVREVAIDDLRAMAKAAAKNGTPIGSWSAYRSYEQQVALFNGYVKAYGYDNAIEFSQRPGHSEHQLGLVIDFMASGADGMLSGESRTGKWMAQNAWKYGWVMSYPPGDDPKHLWNETVCFRYEPWHYRYLGRDIAAKVHESGLTIREYLWANFTMVDPTTGKPIPSASPSPTASPSPEASPTATLSAIAFGSPAPSPGSTLRGSATQPALGGWFGVDPLVVVGMLIVLVSVGLVAARVYLRRSAAQRRARSGIPAQARRRGW